MTQYHQIIIAAIATLAALIFLSPHGVVVTFLIFGNGHVFIAYLYQYRAGKMNAAYHGRFLISVLAIGAFLVLTHFSLPLLTFVTAVVFMVHTVFDEIYLLQMPPGPLLLLAALPVSLLYIVPLSDKLLGTSLSGYAFIAAMVCVVVYGMGVLWKREVSYGGLWMVAFGILLLISVVFYDLSAEKLLGSVILFHYLRWLVFYAHKYWHTPRFASYIRDIFWIHSLVGVLFVWYSLYAGVGHMLLTIFFTETGFYILTLLHICSTSRGNDFARIFGRGVVLGPLVRKRV